MNITILLIIIFATLGFGNVLSKPINNSASFDVSINQRSYQTKIDEYLNKKYNIDKIPTFNIRLVKAGETLINNKKSTEVNKSICYNTKPFSEHRIQKTYKYNGYLKFKDSNIYVHRWVMKKYLGRKLYPTEVVHHIDGNKLNNDIKNLMLFSSQEEHDDYHRECKRRCGTWCAYLPNYNYIKLPAYNR